MPEESDPPRKFYELKEAEFEAVNQRSDHQQSIDVREHYGSAAALSGIPVPKPASRSKPADGLNFASAIHSAGLLRVKSMCSPEVNLACRFPPKETRGE